MGSGAHPTTGAVVYVVDDDVSAREATELLLKTVDLEAELFASPVEFLEAFAADRPSCVVLDLRMPELNGIETLLRLRERRSTVPVIFLTGYGDLAGVVRAMKLGAVDFFEKPVNGELLLESIQHWVKYDMDAHEAFAKRQATLARLAKLSGRQRQVLDCVLNGMSNKETARHLGVSPKAVELYRAGLMRKMGARNVVKLVIDVISCVRSAKKPEALPVLNGRDVQVP
jgi:FixJ family two-component response regulator